MKRIALLLILALTVSSPALAHDHENKTECGRLAEDAARGDFVGAADHVSGCVNSLRGD